MGVQPIHGLDEARKSFAHTRQQTLARFSQLDAARQAAKQDDAEKVFKQLDLMTDGGRRDMQFRSRFAKAQMPPRGLEGAQSFEGRQRLSHLSGL